MDILIVLLIIVAGYFFGTITCSEHFIKKRGFWMTLSVIMILNFFHSCIDGIITYQHEKIASTSAVVIHELLRQSVLYPTVIAMLLPFEPFWDLPRMFFWIPAWVIKIGISILVVTGIWILGFYFGYFITEYIESLLVINLEMKPLFHQIADYSMFFLLGDGLHHLIDFIKKGSFVTFPRTR